MNLSAELIESLRFALSRNYYNEPGIYGVAMRTYKHSIERIKKVAASKIIEYGIFIFNFYLFLPLLLYTRIVIYDKLFVIFFCLLDSFSLKLKHSKIILKMSRITIQDNCE